MFLKIHPWLVWWCPSIIPALWWRQRQVNMSLSSAGCTQLLLGQLQMHRNPVSGKGGRGENALAIAMKSLVFFWTIIFTFHAWIYSLFGLKFLSWWVSGLNTIFCDAAFIEKLTKDPRSQQSGEITKMDGSSEIVMFKVIAIMRFGKEKKKRRTKEKISDSWTCEKTNHKEKDICAGNTGTNMGTI